MKPKYNALKMFLRAVLLLCIASVSTPRANASVYQYNPDPSVILHVLLTHQIQYWWTDGTTQYDDYNYHYQLSYGEDLSLIDGFVGRYSNNENGYVDIFEYYWQYMVWTEPDPNYDPGSGGGGGQPDEPVDPWADVDENGVGTLGEFGLTERTDTVSQAFEWMGMAVGIFVEPVDWVMTAVEIYRDPTNPASYIGLIPGVPAGVGKIVKKSANIASDVLRSFPQGPALKMGNRLEGMDHILRRHAHGMPSYPGHPYSYDGHFKQGWHMTQITDAIAAGLARSGPPVPSNGKLIYEAVLDDVVGKGVNRTTGAISDTRKIFIVVDATNSTVITAFPIPE